MATNKYLDLTGLTYFKSKLDEEYASIKAFVFKGIVADVAHLPSLGVGTTQKVGFVYNVTAEGTTTADFVEGAGHPLQAGENVVVVDVSATSTPELKWDILGGVFDITDRLQFGDSMPANPTDGQTFLYMGEITYEYDEVTPVGTENPQALGWYEYDDVTGQYVLSSDTSVDNEKTYYTRGAEQYITGVIYVYDLATTSWVAQNSGDIMVAITNGEIDALFD